MKRDARKSGASESGAWEHRGQEVAGRGMKKRKWKEANRQMQQFLKFYRGRACVSTTLIKYRTCKSAFLSLWMLHDSRKVFLLFWGLVKLEGLVAFEDWGRGAFPVPKTCVWLKPCILTSKLFSEQALITDKTESPVRWNTCSLTSQGREFLSLNRILWGSWLRDNQTRSQIGANSYLLTFPWQLA